MPARLADGGRLRRLMVAACGVAWVLVPVAFIAAPLPRLKTFQQTHSLSALWSDPALQQVSGYALLGACAATLVLSIRKRLARRRGCLASWRVRHAFIGLTAGLLFVGHTGLHFGRNLTAALAITFLAVLGTGALAGTVARRDKAAPATETGAMPWPALCHLFLFWALAVLATFHIVAVYYF